MRKLLFAFLFIISFNVYALERIALVIGNAKYLVEPLNNSVNDAKNIAALLEELDFEVKLVEDANKTTMNKEIEKFSSQLKENTTSLFFYAGHAVQLHNVNYLLPIESYKAIEKNYKNLNDYEKLELFNDEAISLNQLTKLIESGNSKQNFIILDACRVNQLSVDQVGLSIMSLVSKETLIAYSTSPGKEAKDGKKGGNSPYTKQLLKFIKTPNQPIEIMLKEVGLAVSNETNGGQVPWVSNNLTSNFCFNDVDGGCANVFMPFPGHFLDGLPNLKVKNLDNGDLYVGQMENSMFNGKGVMTYINRAIYEGDFVDDKKEGYGTLTQPNGHSYEGNFLNNKKHGTGTWRYISGATIETEWDMGIRIFITQPYFTGELDDRNQPHGKGVFVTSNGEKFDGVWNHGTLEGVVKVTYSEGTFYEGEWENNNPNGEGKKSYTDGQIYEGNFINGELTGQQGTKTWGNGDVYKGEFLDSKPNGTGTFTNVNGGVSKGEWENGFLNGKDGLRVKINGDRYYGDFLKDQYHGKGIFTWSDGSTYDGQWNYNQKHGKGIFTWTDGKSYEGEYLNDNKHGKGIFTWSDGSTYAGQWKDNQKHGRGKHIWTDGKSYEGEYLNDNKHGKGIFTWTDGSSYDGEFLNGSRNGKGILTMVNGTLWEGVYENDKFIHDSMKMIN